MQQVMDYWKKYHVVIRNIDYDLQEEVTEIKIKTHQKRITGETEPDISYEPPQPEPEENIEDFDMERALQQQKHIEVKEKPKAHETMINPMAELEKKFR